MDDFAKGLAAGVKKVTKKYADQRRREIRDAGARSRRRDVFMRPRRITTQDAAWEIMSTAYNKASANGTLPVQPRQIMYAARGYIQERTGRAFGDSYFTQTILPNYVEQEGVDWDIVWDARGGLHEPHTNRSVRLGTLEVREYLNGQESVYLPPDRDGGWKTTGAKDRYGAVLFVEKEGFLPLFRKVKLAERYDLAIMSTKGVSTTAARTLIDTMVQHGVPVFCIRDFDVSGFTIAGTLGRDTRRYSWTSNGAIDLGLRLKDAQKYGLESESVCYQGGGGWGPLSDDRKIRRKIGPALEKNGATAEEIEFLLRYRVELNAFASDKFIEWIEEKLVKHGVKKVVPDAETLAAAARGFARDLIVERYLETFAAEIDEEVDDCAEALTDDMTDAVAEALAKNPALAWDDALQQIVRAQMPVEVER